MSRSRWAAALALGLVLAATAATGPARAEVVERVVAVVNEDAVFLSELRRRALPFLAAAMQAPSEEERVAFLEQLYSELLDRLIEERLVEQAAARLSLRVTRADVDEAIRNVAESNGFSLADFWDAVRQQGMTEAQYRADVRRQLLRLKVINQRARDRVNVTEEDVRRRYERELRSANRRLEYRLAEIYFPVPPTASATEAAAIRDEAAALAAEVDAETFLDAGGVDLGTLGQGDLPSALEDAVVDVAPGTIAGPVRGPNGYHVLLLIDRERGGAGLPPYEEAKETLFRQMLEEAMERQSAQILDELQDEAVVERRL